MPHIDDGQLHAYLDGALHIGHSAHLDEVEAHLSGCAACQGRLEHERSIRDQAHALLGKAAPADTELRPFEEVIRRAPSTASRRSPRLRAIPLAWAASLVFALGLGWLARSSLRQGGPGEDVPAGMAAVPDSAAAIRPTVGTTAGATSRPSVERQEPQQLARASRAAPASPPVIAAPQPSASLEERPVPVLQLEDFSAPAAPAAAPLARMASPESTVVHGKVTDENGVPLAGVQVQVAGLDGRAVTGRSGDYSLSLPPERLSTEDTLTITAVMLGRETARHPLAIRPGQVRAQDFRLRVASVALEALVVAAGSAKPGWSPVGRAAAEQALGQPLRTVPDLPILAIELLRSADTPVVRVRQRIGRSGTLMLEQVPERQETPGKQSESEGGPHDLSASPRRGEAELVVYLGGARVTARARISPDSLRVLVRRLQ